MPKKTAVKSSKTKPKPKSGSVKPVETVRHKDKRTNIPTEELRDFVREDENAPKSMLYPRDSSLDPQLVWKGKDEQDQNPLEVPVVPIYIQEKIHPQAIIDGFRRTAAKVGGDDPQSNLFADFNGLPEAFEDRVDFYSQKDDNQAHWSNRLILGDSLLVMTSLAEKENLKGKVQTIYLDPPYGIKFGSNWQVSTRKRSVGDKTADVTRQPEQVRAFRDTWKLGIHSYLAYLRDRLRVCHDLLTETGSLFLQIGDENVHLVRSIMDEVFGSENFVSGIAFRKTLPLGTDGLPNIYDQLLWYAKNKREGYKYRQLFVDKEIGSGTAYTWVELPDGTRRTMTSSERRKPDAIPKEWKVFSTDKLTSSGYTASCFYEFELDGVIHKARGKSWRTHPDGMEKLKVAARVIVPDKSPRYVLYFDDLPAQGLNNLWTDTLGATDMVYIVQTATRAVERCILMTTDPGDLVLDPTCGSGTTAYVAEQWGRRWITCDTSRVALSLTRARLMAKPFPYYYLAADHPQAVQMVAKDEIKAFLRKARNSVTAQGDVRKGFVYERVPHVELESIANNPDITEGMNREEIGAAITRHAKRETLYDKPFDDSKRVRVTGPFTVESLSPHRTISVEQKAELAANGQDGWTMKKLGPDQFGNMILENLRTAGVQNTFKQERIKFNSVAAFPGEWIHGEGRYLDGEGRERRAAICIGPEHGTVGPKLVKEAAKEAVKGVGFDILIVCGFAFDPHVSEEAKRYGRLTVLPTNMNPDLAMGESLKKTASANLFTVFGEPDIDIRRDKDGKVVVEIRGLDVYDPTTGEIRSGIATDAKTGKVLHDSRDDVACWFIDTNYNDESFFVRHAYFTGADEPYDKLKRALRAEVDESAWSALYSTTSRPFDPPDTGKIAVKVINHFGDEVLRVYEVK